MEEASKYGSRGTYNFLYIILILNENMTCLDYSACFG